MVNGRRQITVRFRPGVHGNEMACYMWLISIRRNPSNWRVYRGKNGRRRLNDWDAVKRGKVVTLKPIAKG